MSTSIVCRSAAARHGTHDADAGDEHRERREHERRPEDRPHADRVRRLAAAANAIAMIGIIVSGSAVPTAASTEPDRALGQLELAAEPLDAVREQLGAEQDDDEGDREDEQVHLSPQPDGGDDADARRRAGRRAR